MENSDQKYFPNIKQSFGLIILMLLISIPLSIPYIILKVFFEDSEYGGLANSLGFLISDILIFIFIIYIAKSKVKKQGLWEVKWRTKKVPISLIGIVSLMTLALIILIDPLTSLIPMPESIKEMFEEMMQPDIFSFLTLVIAAPILEELFFRGIILEGFLKNYSPWKAIIWSAIIFGVAHANPWQTIGSSIAGILIGWIYYKTKSLIPGMIIHFVNNLLGFLVILYAGDDYLTSLNYFDNKLLYSSLIIISFGILYFGYKTINRKFISY